MIFKLSINSGKADCKVIETQIIKAFDSAMSYVFQPCNGNLQLEVCKWEFNNMLDVSSVALQLV